MAKGKKNGVNGHARSGLTAAAAAKIAARRSCRTCGCTEADCSGCIERTGKPCHWVEKDLCSACVVVGPKQAEIPGMGRVRIKELDFIGADLLAEDEIQKASRKRIKELGEESDRALKKYELESYLYVDGERKFDMQRQLKTRIVMKERKKAKAVDTWTGPKKPRKQRIGADQAKGKKAQPIMPAPAGAP